MESAGKLETAHKTKQSIGQVFRDAIATGRAETDPTPSLKGALPPTRVEHFSALLQADRNPAGLGGTRKLAQAQAALHPVAGVETALHARRGGTVAPAT